MKGERGDGRERTTSRAGKRERRAEGKEIEARKKRENEREAGKTERQNRRERERKAKEKVAN